MPTYQEWIADQNKQRTAAQQGLPQAQMNAQQARMGLAQANNPSGIAGGFNRDAYDAASAASNAANMRLGGLQNSLAGLDPMSADNQAAGNKYQAYDLARGGVSRLQNDPTDQFIRQALQTAAGPEGGPFNATTRNAMFTGAMESSGNRAQVQSIMDSAAKRGMSVNDPGIQAALRRAQGEQAQAGQRARLGIDTVANPANYAAQQSAVNRLGDYNSGRQQQQQSAEDRLREMLWNEGFNKPAPAPQVTTVNWNPAQQQAQRTVSQQPAYGQPAAQQTQRPQAAQQPAQTPAPMTASRMPSTAPAGGTFSAMRPASWVTPSQVQQQQPQPRQVGRNLYSDPYGTL